MIGMSRGPRFDHRRYLPRAHGGRWVVVDPHGARVAGPFGHAEARREADRLNLELAAREKRGPRPCIRCAREFHSVGIHNRMCDPCRNAARDDTASYGLSGLSGARRAGYRAGAR